MKVILFIMLLMSNIASYAAPLIIGALKFAPPFSVAGDENNNYYGFCIDLMDILCTRMHESCEYISTEVETQLADLQSGKFDLTFAISPISTTKNPNYLISLPYIPSKGQFLALNGSSINTIEALVGKNIGVLKASGLKKTVLSRYTSLTHVFEYSKMTDLIEALNTHHVDAILLNVSTAKYVVHNVTNMHVLGDPIQLGFGYGIIALKNRADLIDRINKALLQIESDGTYLTLYEKYFGN